MTTKKTNRILLSGQKKCPFKCLYCFADMACFDAKSLHTIEELTLQNIESKILYPACDTELDFTSENFANIVKTAKAVNASVVSISTKRKLSDRKLDQLVSLKSELEKINILLKYSISISTRNSLDVVEAGTASYLDRLDLARKIKKAGIVLSVNLKPILPFVPAEEYFQIIDDFIGTTPNFMLGGLYIDRESQFGKEIVAEFSEQIESRVVDWLPTQPNWDICVDDDKIDKISEYVRSHGGFAFDGDQEFLSYILESKG